MNFGHGVGMQSERDEPRCASCGAQILSSAATHCWLCEQSLQPGGEMDHSGSHMAGQDLRSGRNNIVMVVIGALAVLLIMAMVKDSPGVLFVLLVLATPALIRTVVLASKEGKMVAWTAVSTFLGSLGVLAFVGAAAGAAFYATCFVVCLGGLALNEATGTNNYEWILIPSVGAGLVPGVMVFWWLIRLFWRPKVSKP